MSAIKEFHFDYTIQVTGAIESVAQDKPKRIFKKMWIYPGARMANGELSVNGANVKVGKDGDGPKTVTDLIGPNDLPLEMKLPNNESMAVQDVLVKGTAGDSIFISAWE
jgi:hypothetical protein